MKNNYILYGLGKSNQAIKEYFDSNNYEYQIYNDNYQNNFKELMINKDTIIVKSPGIKNETSFMKYIINHNLKVITDIGLFYELRPDLYYIGITGTLGKTSTTALCYHLLNNILDDVECAGNIGIPIFKLINKQIKYLILELSSYQLEYLGNFKPNVMIYLNIYHHHLNYHLTFNNYLECKLNPIKNIDLNGLIIINNSFNQYISVRDLKKKVITYSLSNVDDNLRNSTSDIIYNKENNKIYYHNLEFKLPIIDYFKYDYNIENFLSVFILLKYLNIKNDLIYKYLNTYELPIYRMEKIYTQDKLVIYNDSKSTCLKSTIENLKNVINIYKNYKIILIIGGRIDLKEIKMFIKDLIALCDDKVTVYCYGENRFIIKDLFNNVNICERLEEVIKTIYISNRLDQVILFSPGAQSFDQFSSFEDRGRFFNNLIIEKIV